MHHHHGSWVPETDMLTARSNAAAVSTYYYYETVSKYMLEPLIYNIVSLILNVVNNAGYKNML